VGEARHLNAPRTSEQEKREKTTAIKRMQDDEQVHARQTMSWIIKKKELNE